MSTNTNIQIKQFATIEDIPPADWSLPGEPYNPFHELKFLKVLETSKVEQASYDYLIFYQNHKPIATAVLSSFVIDLSLFVGDEPWVKTIKKRWPAFFNVKILFCGTPVSIGHANFHCIDRLQDCLLLLNDRMKTVAKSRNIKIMVLKEVSASLKKAYAPILKKQGWFVGNSIPDTKMKITWPSYEAYLMSMKSSYRRQVLSALSTTNGHLKVTAENGAAILERQIATASAPAINVSDFYKKYLAVMRRAAIKLETLNQPFFEQLQQQFNGQLKYFVSNPAKQSACYALCCQNGEHLHFLWTAKEHEKDVENSYLNQLQAMVLYAIKNGIKYMHIGQTAYYPKMRIGAVPEDRYLFFKSLHPVYHPILRLLRNVIFPPYPLQTVQPFKKYETKVN